jgi:hypothetical protein
MYKLTSTLIFLINVYGIYTFSNASPEKMIYEIGYINNETIYTIFNNTIQTITIDVNENTVTNIIQKGIYILTDYDGTLYIKRGLYMINTNIILNGNIKIIGDGIDITIFKLTDYAEPFLREGYKKSGLIRARFAHNIVVSKITLDGNKDYQNDTAPHVYGRYGIYMEACDNLLYDSVRIINFQGYGFDPHGHKSTNQYTSNLTITNCVAEYNNWDGFTIDQSINVYINNSIARHNGRHGFNIVTGSNNVILLNNRAADNGWYYYNGDSGCGYIVQNNDNHGTRDIVLKNNRNKNSKKAGICLKDVNNIYVINNNINSETCMEFKQLTITLISLNQCTSDRFYKITDTELEYVDIPLIYGENVYMYENTNINIVDNYTGVFDTNGAISICRLLQKTSIIINILILIAINIYINPCCD